MKLSFLPGDLHLTQEPDGSYILKMNGQELFRTRIEKKALGRFNKLREDLETLFPARQLSSHDKKTTLAKYLMDYKAAQVRASTKPPEEKVKGTRTFG
jgi:hypothetical protein